MSSGARSEAQQQQVAGRLEDIIRELVPEGEIVTHFDVVVQTRSGYAARQLRMYRYTVEGSDPLHSAELLRAALRRLEGRINAAGCGTDQ